MKSIVIPSISENEIINTMNSLKNSAPGFGDIPAITCS